MKIITSGKVVDQYGRETPLAGQRFTWPRWHAVFEVEAGDKVELKGGGHSEARYEIACPTPNCGIVEVSAED